MEKDIVAVILAGGIGNRYKDKEVPGRIKQFAPIGPPGNEALIQYSLSQITKTPFRELIFIVGSKTREIYHGEFGDEYNGASGTIPVKYAIQSPHPLSGKPTGTVDAVCSAAELIGDSSFVIFNSDEIFGEETARVAYQHLQNSDDGVTVGFSLEDMVGSSVVNRGIFDVGKDGYVQGITEHYGISDKDIRNGNLSRDSLCNINLFGFHSDVLPLLAEARDSFLRDYEGGKEECILSTELNELVKQDKVRIKAILSGANYYGVTSFEDASIAKKAIQKDIASGVI